MIRLELENCNTISKEKLQKFNYYQVKLINVNISVKKILPPNQKRVIEQAKFILRS